MDKIKIFLFIFIIILSSSCTEKKSTPAEQVNEYYNGFRNSNYKQVKKVISDSLTTIAGDYTNTYTHESYHEKFKWDSIFKPIYKVIALENLNEEIVATVSISSLKLEFLKNDPMTCKYKFYFKSGKISRIEDLDCIDANWKIWRKEVDSLVNWVKFNHPEQDGFINDLTMKGALDYLSAIKLYKESHLKKVE